MIHLGHGANVEDMAAKYGKNPKEVIDFSANINPYSIENLEKYILEGLHRSQQYPDIYYAKLRKNIGAYLGCREEWIIPGNGATEIMYLLMKCIKGPLAIINPTFSEYERSAKLNHVEVVSFDLRKEEEFRLNIKEIKERIDEFDCLFICNPNNPTGGVQNIEELLQMLNKHQKLLVVDETFIEFTENEAYYSLTKHVEDFPNLIIIKAATKFFGLPGIRLGYGITSHSQLLREMYVHKEPWTVNCFADCLAEYIFKESAYVQRTKDHFSEERPRIVSELKKINHFKVYDTHANFVLLELKDNTASEIKERLFDEHGILIRDASNFRGLDEKFIRIAIKTREENDLLLSKLTDSSLFEGSR